MVKIAFYAYMVYDLFSDPVNMSYGVIKSQKDKIQFGNWSEKRWSRKLSQIERKWLKIEK